MVTLQGMLFASLVMAWTFGLPITLQVIVSTIKRVVAG
jgi:hypothetical protein